MAKRWYVIHAYSGFEAGRIAAHKRGFFRLLVLSGMRGAQQSERCYGADSVSR